MSRTLASTSIAFGCVCLFVLLSSALAHADQDDMRHGLACAMGDVNGDGKPDFLLADPSATSDHVWLLSGADGSAVLTLVSSYPDDGFGSSLARLGDVDGDGVPDFAIGARGWRTDQERSSSVEALAKSVTVISSRSGKMLARWRDCDVVACVGDVNGDGTPDLLLSRIMDDPSRGSVRVMDGRSLELLYTIVAPAAGSGMFGNACIAIGDIDGDKTPDFIIGDPGSKGIGAIFVVSGKTGSVLRRVGGREPVPDGGGDSFAWSLALLGDVDGDGVPDIAVGAMARYVEVLSGKTFEKLTYVSSRHGYVDYDSFASSLAGAGDVDGVAAPNFVVGANESAVQLFDEGYALLVSGRSGKTLKVLDESMDEGIDVAAIGDVDGDHACDFICIRATTRKAEIFSGKDGRSLRKIDLASLPSEPTPGSRTLPKPK